MSTIAAAGEGVIRVEMEKSYYLVTYRSPFIDLLRSSPTAEGDTEEGIRQRVIIAITQGGFGQDVIDDERQAKERFLEHLFDSRGIDLPRSETAFDNYFELERIEELVNLDEDVS